MGGAFVMDDGKKQTGEEPTGTSGFFKKKIVYAIVILAVIFLAVVLAAKFVFNIDLLNPESGSMFIRRMR